MEDAPELTHLFDKLCATDKAAKDGNLSASHYLDVDSAIAGVLQKLPPYPTSPSSASDDSIEEEAKGGHTTGQTTVDPASAMKLQALLAQHKGPRRDMVKNKEARGILQGLFPDLKGDELEEMLSVVDRREEEIRDKLDGASSAVGGIQPLPSSIQMLRTEQARRLGGGMDLAIAAGYGECSVCFEHLCTRGASVMTYGPGQAGGLFRRETLPRRVCRHFLCQECAPTIIPRKCPVCRREFAATLNVPDPLADPVKWFQVVDCDQSGTIEKYELVDALKGMFPVEPGALEEVIEMNWRSWDGENNGTIDSTEFRDRLVPFLAESIGNLRQRIDPKLPDLKDQPAEWFRYWDQDESGSLERAEIVRALAKTIPEFTDRDKTWLTETFAAIWTITDPDGDGSITGGEFMMPEGLYETLVANFCRHRI